MSKKKRKGSESVELNLAAMLDMAFQLLTFFILTFKPAPVEGQVDLRLPPPEPVTNVQAKAPPAGSADSKDPVQGLESLIVSIFPTPGGQIGSLAIGESNVAGLGQLEAQLKTILADPGSPFKQVIIQVGAFAALRRINACHRHLHPPVDGRRIEAFQVEFRRIARGRRELTISHYVENGAGFFRSTCQAAIRESGLLLMRRFRRPPPQKLLSGREFTRLMSMLLMLGVLWMMMMRARDPDVWRWLASDPDGGKRTVQPDDDEPDQPVGPRAGKRSEPRADEPKRVDVASAAAMQADNKPDDGKPDDGKPDDGKPADSNKPAGQPAEMAIAQSPVAPVASEDFEKIVPGPTDEDEGEWDAAKEEFQAITDKDVLAAIEMPLYWRLVKWVQAQTFDQLRQRAKTVSYVQLWEQPDEYRGKLIRLKMLHLRQAFKWPATENSANVKVVYDARGWTDDSKVFPYIVLFCDKPPKLRLGSDIHEESTFVGYFLKQMSYRDGLDTRRAAPLLIGRLHWEKNLAEEALQSNRAQAGEFWPVLIGGGVFLVAIVGIWVYRARSPRKRSDLALKPVEEEAVENWIDQIGQDEPEQEAQARNGRTKYANGREKDAKSLDWTDPGLHDETFPGFPEDTI